MIASLEKPLMGESLEKAPVQTRRPTPKLDGAGLIKSCYGKDKAIF
jgi:hypothetical protein